MADNVNLPPKPLGKVTPPTTTLPLSTTSIAFRQQTPAEIVIDQSTNPPPPEGQLQVALNQANMIKEMADHIDDVSDNEDTVRSNEDSESKQPPGRYRRR